MDDGLRLGTLLTVGVDMAHDIVADHLFPGFGNIEVDIFDVRVQLSHLFGGDTQTELMLRPGQSDPELAPGGEFVPFGEKILHFIARVSRGKW